MEAKISSSCTSGPQVFCAGVMSFALMKLTTPGIASAALASMLLRRSIQSIRLRHVMNNNTTYTMLALALVLVTNAAQRQPTYMFTEQGMIEEQNEKKRERKVYAGNKKRSSINDASVYSKRKAHRPEPEGPPCRSVRRWPAAAPRASGAAAIPDTRSCKKKEN